MKSIILIVASLLLLNTHAICCKKHRTPKWLQEKIAELEKQKPHQAKSFIKEYQFNGIKVYYIPADCCDQLNPLYDESGKIICHPSGGITGRGDGKCPDFKPAASDGKLIWEDSRQKKK